MRLSGKVAIVTGAGSGIGRHSAETYARESARVCVSDINLDTARTAAQEIRQAGGIASAERMDVTDEGAVFLASYPTHALAGQSIVAGRGMHML